MLDDIIRNPHKLPSFWPVSAISRVRKQQGRWMHYWCLIYNQILSTAVLCLQAGHNINIKTLCGRGSSNVHIKVCELVFLISRSQTIPPCRWVWLHASSRSNLIHAFERKCMVRKRQGMRWRNWKSLEGFPRPVQRQLSNSMASLAA